MLPPAHPRAGRRSMPVSSAFSPELDRFRRDYAGHRAAEGRGGTDIGELPYLSHGRHARQWAVRARTFEAFLRHVVAPMHRALGRPLDVVDLGAGNGWLSWRLAGNGHRCTAVDIRDDQVDGLGAGRERLSERGVATLVSSFDVLPLADDCADIAVFNASLHYSTLLGATLAEAARVVRPTGRIAILDSPFYPSEDQGRAMVDEKRRLGRRRFGDRADSLLGLPFIEFLTKQRMDEASAPLGLEWKRRRVAYPLWYELRPQVAFLTGKRRPSRFDLWVGRVR